MGTQAEGALHHPDDKLCPRTGRRRVPVDEMWAGLSACMRMPPKPIVLCTPKGASAVAGSRNPPQGEDWAALPPELVAQIYAHLPLRDRKLGERGLNNPLQMPPDTGTLPLHASACRHADDLCTARGSLPGACACAIGRAAAQSMAQWESHAEGGRQPATRHRTSCAHQHGDVCAGRKVCRCWRRGLDTMVTRLRVGPQNREPQAWNRQLLMMQRLPRLFPCLHEIDFDQARMPLPCSAPHMANASMLCSKYELADTCTCSGWLIAACSGGFSPCKDGVSCLLSTQVAHNPVCLLVHSAAGM